MQSKKQHNITMILSTIYFLILIWILLFKMNLSIKDIYKSRSINLIPFGQSVIVNGKIYINEIIGNIFVFIPIGIYTCMLGTNWSFIKKIAPSFIISLAIEGLQFVFALGTTDVTDLLGNTLGGIVGIGIFLLLSKVLKNKTVKVLNILALIATIGLIILLSMLIILN